MIALLGVLVASCAWSAAAPAAPAGLVGLYRCSEARFDGRPAACPPDLVLFPDGTYALGPRRGAYGMKDGALVLSGVGAAAVWPDGRLGFSWIKEGRELDVAYARQSGSSVQASGSVPVGLGVRFVEAALAFARRADAMLLEPGDGSEALRAPAVLDGQGILRAQFPSVPSGRAYTIVAAAGGEQRAVGILDLRVAGAPVVYELRVK